jgi:tight adherence protein B
MDILIAAGSFAALLSIALLVLSKSQRGGEGKNARRLLERVTRDDEESRANEIIRTDPRRRAGGSSALAALYRLKPLERLEQSLWQAGIYRGVSELLLIVAALAVAGFAAAELIVGDLMIAFGAAVGCGTLPLLYVRWRRRRRLNTFSLQLPFALDLIRSSLEAGHSVLRGIQVIVDEFVDPLGGEFRIVLEQTRLGMSVTRAFDELLQRVPGEDLRLLVVAIKVQSEVGSSLAQIIGRLAEIVRTRQRLHAQIHAMTSQSRMSGKIVGLLPLAVLGAFSLIQPGYVHVLFYDPMGIKVLKAAIVLDGVAFFIINRILAVEY